MNRGTSFSTKSPGGVFSVGGGEREEKKKKKRECITDAGTHQDDSFVCYFNYRENMENKTIYCIPCFMCIMAD